MEIGFTIASVLIILFVVLATYDGVYLHIFKYRLYNQHESKAEHLSHTIRAVLFPFILYFLYLQQDLSSFYIGLAFVFLDLVTMAADAYMEKDSRKFMGGLPGWEYIIHLFVNGFHFAVIAVYLILKLDYHNETVVIRSSFSGIHSFGTFEWLIWNLLPGAFLTAVFHIVVANKYSMEVYERLRNKVTCC